MTAVSEIYVQGCNSHLIGWHPRHSVENVQIQFYSYACLETVHTKTVSNEGCAYVFVVCLGLPQSIFESCKFRDYSVVIMLCWSARLKYNHFTGFGPFTFIYINSVPYEATPSGSNISLISSKHICVCKNGEQVVVGKRIGTSKMLMVCPWVLKSIWLSLCLFWVTKWMYSMSLVWMNYRKFIRSSEDAIYQLKYMLVLGAYHHN